MRSKLWVVYCRVNNALGIDPCVPPVRHQHSPLRNHFCCKDRKWILGTHHPEEKYWTIFCKATSQDHLLENPHFTDSSGKPVNYRELIDIFDKVFAGKTRGEWMEIFQPEKLMFSSVQKIEEVARDPQALNNGYVVPFDYAGLGDIRIPGYPIHFSQCHARTRDRAPAMGEHTEQVLREIGYTNFEIASLKQNKIAK